MKSADDILRRQEIDQLAPVLELFTPGEIAGVRLELLRLHELQAVPDRPRLHLIRPPAGRRQKAGVP